MPKIFHKKNIPFEMRGTEVPEYNWKTTPRLGSQSNSKNLSFDIRSLDPGKFSFPYHAHRASEELFYIISGEVTLRSPAGFEKLESGDLVFFEEGPSSAHQLYNHADAPCVYLDIRSAYGIDVTDYPDTGKIVIFPSREVFQKGTVVDYFKGEENPSAHWPMEILRK
jgi:uncharacterized cupin superfamily protein